jgi:hypothetical protein
LLTSINYGSIDERRKLSAVTELISAEWKTFLVVVFFLILVGG